MRALMVTVAAISLAACGRSGDEGTSVSIDAGNGSAAVDGATGEVTVDTPMMKGSFKLPKIQFTADNFEINGVHLYPGTKIGAMDVNADDGGGRVRVKFASPAPVATVRDWLSTEFEKAGMRVDATGNSVSGTSDGKPFRIDLRPQGNQAAGEVTIGG